MRADDEAKLIDTLRKIEALFEGATTDGERTAAAEARNRIRARLEEIETASPPVEYRAGGLPFEALALAVFLRTDRAPVPAVENLARRHAPDMSRVAPPRQRRLDVRILTREALAAVFRGGTLHHRQRQRLPPAAGRAPGPVLHRRGRGVPFVPFGAPPPQLHKSAAIPVGEEAPAALPCNVAQHVEGQHVAAAHRAPRLVSDLQRVRGPDVPLRALPPQPCRRPRAVALRETRSATRARQLLELPERERHVARAPRAPPAHGHVVAGRAPGVALRAPELELVRPRTIDVAQASPAVLPRDRPDPFQSNRPVSGADGTPGPAGDRGAGGFPLVTLSAAEGQLSLPVFRTEELTSALPRYPADPFESVREIPRASRAPGSSDDVSGPRPPSMALTHRHSCLNPSPR